MDLAENERIGIHRGCMLVFVTDFNEMAAEYPEVIAVAVQRLARISLCEQVLQERREHFYDRLARRDILVVEAP